MMNTLRKLADNRQSGSLATKWRMERFALFQSFISSLNKPINILDAGGTELFWKRMGFPQASDARIVLLNTEKVNVENRNFVSVVDDARDMSKFGDKEFDVVFSNSTIEHVGGYDEQCQMAEEMRRVGKRYFLQTPNRFFPIEPHFLFPFFQFLPLRVRVFLVRRFDLGFYGHGDISEQEAMGVVGSIRLLTERELRNMFPGGTIYKEKLFGLTKSLIVYGE